MIASDLTTKAYQIFEESIEDYHKVDNVAPANRRQEKAQVDKFMPTAGGRKTLDFAGNKGINVVGELQGKRNAQEG